MSTPRSRCLLAALLALLASRGLGAEGLDPWRGWVVFKQFAREMTEEGDPGVSVQISAQPLDDTRLYFIRQVLAKRGRWMHPVGGVVCEFAFDASLRPVEDWGEWSFDHSTFERFVDAVEQHPHFADLVTERSRFSRVYWKDA